MRCNKSSQLVCVSARVNPSLAKRLAEYRVETGLTTSRAIDVLLTKALDDQQVLLELERTQRQLQVLCALLLGNIGSPLTDDEDPILLVDETLRLHELNSEPIND